MNVFRCALLAFVLALATLAGHAQTPAVMSAAAPTGADHISIEHFKFAPATLTVPVGTTVVWTNLDAEPHTVMSTDHVFKSAGLDTRDHYEFTFAKPGVYTYFCSVHPFMTGTITVTAAEARRDGAAQSGARN